MARILIVEDEEGARRGLMLMVQQLGHEPFPAASGKEAVGAANEVRPDVILMDLSLPDIDGYETMRLIRAENEGPIATVIALTASGRPEDINRTAAAGMTYHLVKPVHPDLLKAALESLDKPLK